MEFTFTPLSLREVVLIKRKVFPDQRGFLIKEYEETHFLRHISSSFKEEYISLSVKNVLRGLHFQREPKPQGKYVSLINGSTFEVAVDVRPDSESYLKYTTMYLDSKRGDALWIPEGFAHGFLALEENTIVINRCTNEFDPSLESGLRWNDKKLGVIWPISDPIISEKDRNWAPLR